MVVILFIRKADQILGELEVWRSVPDHDRRDIYSDVSAQLSVKEKVKQACTSIWTSIQFVIFHINQERIFTISLECFYLLQSMVRLIFNRAQIRILRFVIVLFEKLLVIMVLFDAIYNNARLLHYRVLAMKYLNKKF